MEREFSYIAKEEIIRNIVKTHNVVLVLGWCGTGKTASSLKAVKSLWKPYYFNAPAALSVEDLHQYNSEITVLDRLDELPEEDSARAVLIIDDLDGAAAEVAAAVKGFISRKGFPGKIIITAEAQPKLDEVGAVIEAVVRLKDDTAQVLHSRLRDID